RPSQRRRAPCDRGPAGADRGPVPLPARHPHPDALRITHPHPLRVPDPHAFGIAQPHAERPGDRLRSAQGDIRVTNTGGGTLNPWTLRWTFTDGQQIGQGWNGTFSQAGASVTVTGPEWGPALAPGASATVGFSASWNGANSAPASFTLNGAGCRVA
ncbi:cellulose-binding domain-containing protein, partial [Sphaerisporangium melleum]